MGSFEKKAIIPRSSGHSVLLIAPPKLAGSSQYAENRLNTIKNALKDGFANRLTISGTAHLESPEAQDGMPPMNWKEMDFWLMDDFERPELIITNGQVFELYDPIIQGYINAVVHHKPASEYNSPKTICPPM